jgi:hypothetical protein
VTDPLAELLIDEDAAVRALVLDMFGPPIPNQPTGEQFLAQLALGHIPAPGPAETIEDVLADYS